MRLVRIGSEGKERREIIKIKVESDKKKMKINERKEKNKRQEH